MTNGAGVKPPGIGEALGVGWETFKKYPGPILLGLLCAWVVSLIPVVGGFWAIAGFFNVSLKAVRGQKPEPADAFIAFKAGMLDHIVVGLLQVIGVILCCIGQLVTQPLFFMGTFFVLDRNMTYQEAINKCLADIKPNLFGWILFHFVISIVASLGVLLCGVGLLVTLPIMGGALAHAYQKCYGAAAAKP